MTITTADKLETALTSTNTRANFQRGDPSGGNAVTGSFVSYWRATLVGPGSVGAIPTSASAVNHLTAGAIPFTQQTSPQTSYLVELAASSSITNTTVEIHDRLIHMGGLNGNINTVQAVTGLDLDSFLSSENIANRIGDANYSDVQWWAEFYTDIGGTASTATIGVTYNDGTVGSLTGIPSFGRRSPRMLPLNSLIPAANSGKYIRAISNVVLSANTGTVGNFGFTATRYRAAIHAPHINKMFSKGWNSTGMPEIYNNSCLFPVVISGGSDSGTIRIQSIIAHG